MKKIIAITMAAAMLMMSGCSSKGGDTVADVNGKKITKADIQFYQDNMKGSLDTSNGVTEGAIEGAINDKMIIALAEKKGIELSEDEQKQLTGTVRNFRVSRGGMKLYEKYLRDTGLEEVTIQEAIKAMMLKDKLTDDGTEVTDDDKKTYFKDNYYRAKHILIATKDNSTGEEYDETKLAEAKTKADEMLQKAQAGDDFDALMNENSEDPGSKSSPDGYVFTAGEMVPEFEEAVKNCEIGKITMCQSDFGYHIILRLPLDETPEMFDTEYEKVASNLDSKIKDDKFSSELEGMANEQGITVKKYDKAIEAVTADLASATPYPTPTPDPNSQGQQMAR